MQTRLTLEDILSQLENARAAGATESAIKGISTLSRAESGDLSFLGNRKYKKDVAGSRASVLLLPEDFEGEPKADQVFVYVKNPSLALARICRGIEQSLWPQPKPGVHPSAIVASDARVSETATVCAGAIIEKGASVGARSIIGSGAYLGRDVHIGEDCWVMPRVSVMDYCVLGDRVRVQPGAVIGSDGFGYEWVDGAHHKVPQIGRVLVENDVEIGANTTIDRARFGETRIGTGSKIDNLVQIAHNVVIGAHCIVVSQVGISGSTTLEDGVVLGGQAGLAGHLNIGKGSQVGAQSGLNHDLEPGSYVRGTPVYPYMLAHKIDILKKRLPDLFKRVASLEEMVEHLNQSSA